MTAREIKIAAKILDYLHSLDGGQAHALTIHAEIGGMPVCGAQEFDDVLAQLDTQKYILGIQSKFKGRLWNITDAGESARLQIHAA